MAQRRAHVAKVRLSDTELGRLDDLCAATGLSRADQLRFSTLGQSAADALAYGSTLAALLAQMGKVGSNVNQIAHHANSTGELPALDQLAELSALLAEVRGVIMAARK